MLKVSPPPISTRALRKQRGYPQFTLYTVATHSLHQPVLVVRALRELIVDGINATRQTISRSQQKEIVHQQVPFLLYCIFVYIIYFLQIYIWTTWNLIQEKYAPNLERIGCQTFRIHSLCGWWSHFPIFGCSTNRLTFLMLHIWFQGFIIFRFQLARFDQSSLKKGIIKTMNSNGKPMSKEEQTTHNIKFFSSFHVLSPWSNLFSFVILHLHMNNKRIQKNCCNLCLAWLS